MLSKATKALGWPTISQLSHYHMPLFIVTCFRVGLSLSIVSASVNACSAY